MTCLKVACIGSGYFSQFHYEAWQRINSAQLIASVDSDISKASKHSVPAYMSVKSMLDEHTPDIVDIIVPPTAHLSIIKQCLESGISNIICQKPFCNNKAEAMEAVRAAKNCGANLVVHENFRFQPWYRRMKIEMDQGRLGEIHQFVFRLRTGDGQGPDAYLDRQPYFQKMEKFLIHETGVHWLDTFSFLFGEPVSVYADLARKNENIAGEDAGYFLLDFKNGVRALFDGNRNLDHPAKNTRTTLGEALLEGTKGSISLLGDGQLSFREFGKKEDEVLLEPYNGPGFAGDCVYELQRHVVQSIQQGLVPENTAEDYLNILSLEEAVYASASSNRKIWL